MKNSISPLERALLPFRRRMSPKFHSTITGSIARLLPASQWYSAAFRLTSVIVALTRPIISWTPYRKEFFLNRWLTHFLQYGRPFPIPIRTVGEEVIEEARANPTGMVTVSVHLPLGVFVIRSLMELDCTPDAIIASEQQLKQGMFPIGGKANAVPGLASNGNVLVKARSILRRGGSIGTMIDPHLGAPINANLLHLLGSIGGRLVFALAELQVSGDLLVQFYNPPDPFCRCREGILKNLEFIQQKVDDVMRRSLQPIS